MAQLQTPDERAIQALVAEQRRCFKSGAGRDVTFRIRQLEGLREAVNACERRILEALRPDLGQSACEGYLTEVGLVREEIRFAIRRVVPSPPGAPPVLSLAGRQPHHCRTLQHRADRCALELPAAACPGAAGQDTGGGTGRSQRFIAPTVLEGVDWKAPLRYSPYRRPLGLLRRLIG